MQTLNEYEALTEAIELLRQTQRLLRRTWSSKGDFAYAAQLHVLAVESFLEARPGAV